MTISSLTTQTVGQGNGSTTVFNYGFLIPTASEVIVTYTDPTGVVTALTANQYAISGLGNALGGTIVYPLAGVPIPSGSFLTITRSLPLLQLTSLSNQGSMWPSSVEGALDYLTMCLQQLNAKIGALTTPTPTTTRQIKLALLNAGVLQTVLNAIPGAPTNANFIAWNGPFISPGDSLAVLIQTTLGYSAAQMQALFQAANLLEP